MNASSDAAESIVRLSLEGVEVAARITGSGAKNVAAILYALSKEQHKLKGKTKLKNMLKSGKPLKVFSIKQGDYEKFKDEAKRYGVLYSPLLSNSSVDLDGMIDIMAYEEDASKINRIIKRFKMATVDISEIKSKVQQDKESKAPNEKGVETKSQEEKIFDDIVTKPLNQEVNQDVNPNIAKTGKSPQSERSSENNKISDQGTNKEKPSVRKELKEIKEELKKESELEQTEKSKSSKNKVTKHQQPKKKKNKKKER